MGDSKNVGLRELYTGVGSCRKTTRGDLQREAGNS